MKISELIAGSEYILRGSDAEITSVAYDSRRVRPGSLFFCIGGLKRDGHEFAEAAVAAGASALMVSRELDADVPQIVVSDDRAAMARLSARFYGEPAKRMKMIGITGTNGKTTTAFLIKSIVEQAGIKAGMIGTIANYIGSEALYTEKTTPESPDLQALLGRMADEDVRVCVMEVSSHSLDLKRVEGIRYDVGVFTNLTQDHLDYHKNLENYRAAKKRLFDQSCYAVVNADDSESAFMLGGVGYPRMLFGINGACDVRAERIDIDQTGSRFAIASQFGGGEIRLNIPGQFSVYNALAAAGACFALGFTFEQVKAGLEAVSGVPGRVDTIACDRGYSIILDYAHTPDGLENVLRTIKSFATGRIITVFGCGGDRDKGKRPEMGAIAQKYSDFCVVTSDNPRTETPAAIIDDILAGMGGEQFEVIEDRRAAIAFALDFAKRDDIILLAGKGHETYQEIDGARYPFDEKAIVAELLDGIKEN